VGIFADDVGVRLVPCVGGTCAAARNAGGRGQLRAGALLRRRGHHRPEKAVDRILALHEDEGRCLVLYRLGLPGARAPSLALVDLLGAGATPPPGEGQVDAGVHELRPGALRALRPFDESRVIAEEWPLTGAAYRYHRERFLYDRSLTARTSSRRMELQPCGYLRTFLKWVSVVLFPRARTDAYERIRHQRGYR
jgi:hypothetical protein